MWYTLDGGPNRNFTTNSTFHSGDWIGMGDGVRNIVFYANDTLGNINSEMIAIIKDSVNPSVVVNSPQFDQPFNETAPSFNVEITDDNLNITWYRLWNLTDWSQIYIFSSNETINQSYWDLITKDDYIYIYFYANDSAGNTNITSIRIIKDITAPIITVINPVHNQKISRTQTEYYLIITDLSLNTTWYRIWDGTSWSNNYTASTIPQGTINIDLWESVWNSLSHGDVFKIEFFANDSFGRIGSFTRVVVKNDPPQPPEFDLITIIIIGSIVTISLVGIIIVVKKRGGPGKEAERIQDIIES